MIANVDATSTGSGSREAGEDVAEARRDEAAAAEMGLRFCVETRTSGRVVLRYFRGPKDPEGIEIKLNGPERDALAFALLAPGFHPVLRQAEPGAWAQGELWEDKGMGGAIC